MLLLLIVDTATLNGTWSIFMIAEPLFGSIVSVRLLLARRKKNQFESTKIDDYYKDNTRGRCRKIINLRKTNELFSHCPIGVLTDVAEIFVGTYRF